MSQAKTLSEKEFRVVLKVVSQQRHAKRNRAMLLMSFWAGLRAGELATLKYGDIVVDGAVTNRITLSEAQTKGTRGRTVMVGEKLRKELCSYAESLPCSDRNTPFFYSQRSQRGMSANTVAQLFGDIYRAAGLDGASSHSGRRTFLTTLANKGVSVRVLMALAGHRQMSTTQRYIDLNDGLLNNAVNLL